MLNNNVSNIMSEDSPRKTVQRKDAAQWHQSHSVRASGDSGRNIKARSKTKNTIPKRLRYDLENALVGLCDIWFEEIKPYLVRNNIKLHVHDDIGGGSGDRGEAPSTYKCSHLDPGRSDRPRHTNANFANSCSTQPTVLKAHCRKQQLSQPSQEAAHIRNYFNDCKKETARKPRKRRKFQQTQSRQPVPRLCRTYSIPPLSSPIEKIASTLKPISPQNNKDLKLKKKLQMKNASTQTDYFPDDIKITKKNFNAKSSSPKFFRRDAKTSLLHSKQNVHQKDIALFQDDLINIIAKRHEKKLEVLFTSPRKNDFPSIMNLYASSKVNPNPKEFNRIPPWR